ncbi:MAG: sugar transferase [Candidatus Kerfeldbacteria bacterium]|nr:sugar transferase [Candidatus Kerfeldbacteria bacterium]
MKKSELLFSAILVPVDYCMVVIAGIFAYNLRFFSFFTEIRPVFYEIDFREFFTIILVVAGIYVITFAMSGLYAIKSTRRLIDEVSKVIVAGSAAIAIVIIIIFFQRELFSSRFIILSGWILTIIMVIIGRSLVRMVQRYFLKRGIGLHNVIIVGDDATTEDIVKQIYQRPTLGYRIVERSAQFDEEFQARLIEKMKSTHIDELILGNPTIDRQQVLAMRNFCTDHHLIYKYATDLFEVQPTHVEINTIADIPIIEVRRTKLDGWGKIAKRSVDLVCSSLGLIILSPVFLLISLIVMIDSQGGIFVRLERIGYKGKRFRLYKFRSMVRNAETLKKDLVELNERADGPLFKIKNDPRITRVGRFLRKTSLDELPQLYNVLRGEMSLVGPRPHEPEEVSRYERWQRKLLMIKPGMTGLAQISGRSELRFEEEARLDLYYVENWSPALDIRIIIKTPWVVVTGKSAA